MFYARLGVLSLKGDPKTGVSPNVDLKRLTKFLDLKQQKQISFLWKNVSEKTFQEKKAFNV